MERTNVLFLWKFSPNGSKKLGAMNRVKGKKSFKNEGITKSD
jgi:hypothetical protein